MLASISTHAMQQARVLLISPGTPVVAQSATLREMMSPMKLLPCRRRPQEGAGLTWRPIPAWWWMLAAAGAVVIVALVVTWLLLAIASGAKAGTDRANSRLDAVRTGLAAGAGAGAAVGLMLAFRRHYHQEVATDLTNRDATERRITELYTKAVEQLGNEKAPVRLGGLYALERLAQDNPAQRQTIVNVICAYLRMPFSRTVPMEPEGKVAKDLAKRTETEARISEIRDTWWQERQVRLTAQRILAAHLHDGRKKELRSTHPPSAPFWPNIVLDLADATLMEFYLVNAMVADANFRGATFTAATHFENAAFDGLAWFDGATFDGDVRFDNATFSEGAKFGDATFTGEAYFDNVTFNGTAWFDQATFSGGSGFRTATFNDDAWFVQASFSEGTLFDSATFSRKANFLGAKATQEGILSFKQSSVLSPSAQHSWPTGWCLESDGKGGYTVVRAKDDGSS